MLPLCPSLIHYCACILSCLFHHLVRSLDLIYQRYPSSCLDGDPSSPADRSRQPSAFAASARHTLISSMGGQLWHGVRVQLLVAIPLLSNRDGPTVQPPFNSSKHLGSNRVLNYSVPSFSIASCGHRRLWGRA